MIQFFFASVFYIFATNVVFSPDPLSFSPVSMFCFLTERLLFRHLDFDEQGRDSAP